MVAPAKSNNPILALPVRLVGSRLANSGRNLVVRDLIEHLERSRCDAKTGSGETELSATSSRNVSFSKSRS
jgi:hypothetical protein